LAGAGKSESLVERLESLRSQQLKESEKEQEQEGKFYRYTYRLDFGRLFIQWFFVSLPTAALMFYFKE